VNRRTFVAATTASALAPRFTFGQQALPRVGVLNPVALEKSMVSRPVIDALAALGYRDGREIKLEYRSSEANPALASKLARELLELKCDVILALGTETEARAFVNAKTATPIVFFAVDYDPLQKGIVSNLRRPGANVTGVYGPVLPLTAKKLEIAREVLPAARRFLVLSDRDSKDQLDTLRESAAKLSVELLVVEFERRPFDIEGAFTRASRTGVDGFIGLSSPGLGAPRVATAQHILAHKLPAFVGRAFMMESAYLVAYTTDIAKAAQQVARISIRVLQGAKPGDIPVEQAGDFELVINNRMAKVLDVKIPYTLLARATRSID